MLEGFHRAVRRVRRRVRARQAEPRHAARRVGRVQILGGGNGVATQRNAALGHVVGGVPVADVSRRMPEAADNGLEPERPATKPLVPRRIGQIRIRHE